MAFFILWYMFLFFRFFGLNIRPFVSNKCLYNYGLQVSLAFCQREGKPELFMRAQNYVGVSLVSEKEELP